MELEGLIQEGMYIRHNVDAGQTMQSTRDGVVVRVCSTDFTIRLANGNLWNAMYVPTRTPAGPAWFECDIEDTPMKERIVRALRSVRSAPCA